MIMAAASASAPGDNGSSQATAVASANTKSCLRRRQLLTLSSSPSSSSCHVIPSSHAITTSCHVQKQYLDTVRRRHPSLPRGSSRTIRTDCGQRAGGQKTCVLGQLDRVIRNERLERLALRAYLCGHSCAHLKLFEEEHDRR